jgi:putative transposase
MDNARWHTSKELIIPANIEILHIPPYTPEMNPIEQIWKELRKGFSNKFFTSLNDVINNLENEVKNLTHETVISITCRDWISKIY